jgi:hypothetical protein
MKKAQKDDARYAELEEKRKAGEKSNKPLLNKEE